MVMEGPERAVLLTAWEVGSKESAGVTQPMLLSFVLLLLGLPFSHPTGLCLNTQDKLPFSLVSYMPVTYGNIFTGTSMKCSAKYPIAQASKLAFHGKEMFSFL